MNKEEKTTDKPIERNWESEYKSLKNEADIYKKKKL